MEKLQDEQVVKDKFPNEQVFEQKLHGENETAYCQAGGSVTEIGNIVIVEDKGKNMQADTSEIKDVADHLLTNSSGSLGEVESFHPVTSSINLSDMYSTEKFGHDLLHFIEHGHSLENWHHSYQDTTTDAFSSHMEMESVPIQQCINADIQSTSKSTITLTVLNSPSTDEPAHFSFSFAQPNTQNSSIIDHDYCIDPKLRNSVTENYHGSVDNYHGSVESYHGSVDNSALIQPGQHEPGMDQEKLQRMKRRKEKNRECSRQFRLKQKSKEENLTKGKMEKARELENLKRNVEKLKATLSKVAQQCNSKCPKTRMLLSQNATFNQENISPEYMKITK